MSRTKRSDEETIDEFFMHASSDLVKRQQERIALILKLRQKQGEVAPEKPARKPREKRGNVELKEPAQ